jgi:signal peptidase I
MSATDTSDGEGRIDTVGTTAVTTSDPPGPPEGGAIDSNDAPSPEAPRPKRKGGWLIEAVVVIVVAVLAAVLLRAFVLQTFYIPSISMSPTLQVGDRIIVSKLSYHLHGVGRNDIVVFSTPPTEDCGGTPVKDLVKRVIGLPGDTVSLKHGDVYIDNKKVSEPYLTVPNVNATTPGPAGPAWSLQHPYKVPANNYFVMGDNRLDSCDSRYWGPVSKNLLVGKVVMRVYPLSDIKFF